MNTMGNISEWLPSSDGDWWGWSYNDSESAVTVGQFNGKFVLSDETEMPEVKEWVNLDV